jgi:hypothetical protein
MADEIFMYAVTAGVFAAFTALLFTARAKRYRDVSKSTPSEQRSSPI